MVLAWMPARNPALQSSTVAAAAAPPSGGIESFADATSNLRHTLCDHGRRRVTHALSRIGLFISAQTLALIARQVTDADHDLEAQITRSQDQLTVLHAALQRAAAALEVAQTEALALDAQIARQWAKIRALEHQLLRSYFVDDSGSIVGNLLNIATGLMTFAGLDAASVHEPGLIKALWSTVDDQDLQRWSQVGALVERVNGLTGGIYAIIHKTKDFISHAQIIEDICRSHTTAADKGLLRESVNLIFARAQKERLLTQAIHEKEALAALIRQTEAERHRAERQHDLLHDDLVLLAEVRQALIRRWTHLC